MKKLFLITLALGLTLAMSNLGWVQQCATIQDGGLTDAKGNPITTGYDDFGYNYQAHMFNGRYCDYDRVIGGPYCDVELIMKWNDGWLSNKDCVGDGKLDRHFGYVTNRGSGAWLTNHQSGWVDVNGKKRKWTYFVKIVAAPTDAWVGEPYDIYGNGTYYTTGDNIEIGPQIWGEFAVIERISNDPSYGEHGILYKSSLGPGFGIYGAEGN